MDKELIRVENLKKYYDIKGGIITHTVSQIQAVDGIDFSIKKGETLGLVGESVCGKSTIGQLLVGLLSPTDGAIYYHGEKIGGKSLTRGEKKARKQAGTNLQMIFQDSYSSLNPRKHIYDILAQPMLYHGVSDKKTIDTDLKQLLDMVGLPQSALLKYPHEFSGGMRQRVVIAIAVACHPDILICDEPTTALDVTIQAQVLDMMDDLKKKYNTAMILITHDLGVVGRMCDNVAVIYAGEVLEYGSKEEIFLHPQHPYTIGLFGAIPDLSVDTRRLANIEGLPPDPTDLPTGCCFNPRCPHATDKCRTIKFPLTEVRPGHFCSCPYCEAAEKED